LSAARPGGVFFVCDNFYFGGIRAPDEVKLLPVNEKSGKVSGIRMI
jgi:hypothetical protein